MMTDFYEIFDENDEHYPIPSEIFANLNKELPENLTYFSGNDGNTYIVPKDSCDSIILTTEIDYENEDDKQLVNVLKTISKEKWPEYLYRTQKGIAVKNIRIGNESKLIPIEKTTENPFSDSNNVLVDCRMTPGPFNPPIPFVFEIIDGKRVTIHFQQKEYDSITEILFGNIDYPALNIELYIYSPLSDNDEKIYANGVSSIRGKYSVNPNKAVSVNEAVEALRIFKGMYDGTTKVNGHEFFQTSGRIDFESEQLDAAISFWETAALLEEKLKVRFNPGADFPLKDVNFFDVLCTCLIKDEPVVWTRPFEHFHVKGIKVESDKFDLSNLPITGDLYYKFIEGPINVSLLGANFEIYSKSELLDFSITNIEWDDESKEDAEFYITDAPNKVFKLRRLYITKDIIRETNL